MIPTLKIFSEKEKLADILAEDFAKYMELLLADKEQIDIALSGGSTPTLFFRALVKLQTSIDWSKIHIYWVDERCVPPDHSESNYGVALKELIKPLNIPEESIFRIRGEEDSEKEAERYAEQILDKVSPDMSFPVFDLVFLGMGADGHTASVFPDQKELWSVEKLCAVGIHPESGQKRVTFTGHLINAASRVIFMVTGEEKAEIVKRIMKQEDNYLDYPASLVCPNKGDLEWYLDKAAARFL